MDSRVVVRFAGMLLAFVFAASCSSSKKRVDTPPDFPERVFSGPWAMETTTLERFKTNVEAINMGDDVTRVIALLGPPDADKKIAKNEKIRIFEYYVKRQHADSPIESDRYVSIVLNDHNAVKSIYSNVEDIPSRNWPGGPP
jgi:hypothetical protein